MLRLLGLLVVPALAICDGGQAAQLSLLWDRSVSMHLAGYAGVRLNVGEDHLASEVHCHSLSTPGVWLCCVTRRCGGVISCVVEEERLSCW